MFEKIRMLLKHKCKVRASGCRNTGWGATSSSSVKKIQEVTVNLSLIMIHQGIAGRAGTNRSGT